ncbi:hypothetical protein GF369_03505 [Candidatus Peregrinibacteria bacterium]|nr:hypothetical protein [Candidatus Peregrinibacteria bacterium]
MNSEYQNNSAEHLEKRIDTLNESGSFLDSIRALAHRTHTKVLVLATLAGLGGAAACDMPRDDARTEIIDDKHNENQNELFEGCEPFSRCLTTGLYDDETSERVGFSFWYEVPENEEYDNVSFKILDLDDNIIGEDTLYLTPGTAEFWVTKPGYEGDFEDPRAPEAGGIEVEFPDGTTITIRNQELFYQDDEPPEF